MTSLYLEIRLTFPDLALVGTSCIVLYHLWEIRLFYLVWISTAVKIFFILYLGYLGGLYQLLSSCTSQDVNQQFHHYKLSWQCLVSSLSLLCMFFKGTCTRWIIFHFS